jgi:PAS domain S-box-containing protein
MLPAGWHRPVSGQVPESEPYKFVFGGGLLVFAAIAATGVIGLMPALLGGRVPIWLLGSGIALAAVIRWGATQCVPIYLAEVVIDVVYRHAWAPALLNGLGLPLGVLLTVWLLKRFRFDTSFECRGDVPLFVGAGLVGMVVPAVIGVAVYSTYFPIDVEHTRWGAVDFLRWWLNDFVGLLLLGPLLVALRRGSFALLLARRPGSLTYLGLLAALLATMLLLPPFPGSYGFAQAPVLVGSTVLVAVGCLLYGFVSAAAVALLISITAAACFAFNVGVFNGVATFPGLVMLWSQVSMMIGASLLLTGLLAEQRRLELRYAEVFENCPQPLLVCSARSGRLLLVNAAAERQYGWSRNELLAGGIELLAAPSREEQSLGEALRVDSTQPLELRQRTRDGRLIDLEIWAQPIDCAGQPAWLVFAFDVTEHRSLEGALVDAVSGEQRRLGQELHDGLGQELTAAALMTGQLAVRAERMQVPFGAELRQLAQRINACIDTARTIANGLSPLAGVHGDLGAALTTLAKGSSVGDTEVGVDTRFEAGLRLPLEARTHLYRIAQEALRNALKHAGARHVGIHLTVQPERVLLEIVDDGRGLPRADAEHAGFGTATMRYRSSAIGGRLTISPRPGGGTMIVCSVPQPPSEAAQSLPGEARGED